MKNLFSKIIARKDVFFIFLTIIILGLNLTPLVAHSRHSPKGRTFALIHNNTQDFFFYQSLLNQGANGAWLTSDPYTTESHQPSIIFSYFLWLGKLSKLLSLPYAVIYHLVRIIISIFFLLSTFYFLLSLQIPYPRLTFFFFLFSSPFMHAINDYGKITSVPFMHWWTGMDAIRRIAYLPHHMAGSFLLVLSIILLINYSEKSKIKNQKSKIHIKNKKYKYFILLILFAALMAFIHTPSLLIILLIFPPAVIVHYVLSRSGNSRSQNHLGVGSPPVGGHDSPEVKGSENCLGFGHLNLPACAGRFRISNFEFRISYFIGLLVYWIIGLFFLLAMLFQTQRGFPWSQYIDWEKKLQFPLDRELIGAFGVLFPLAIIGVVKAFFSKRFDYILIACWFVVPLFLIPFAPKLGLSNIRLIQGVPYLPLAILAVLGIDPITGFLTAAIAKISKIIPIKSGQKSPKNAYLASKITGSPARSASTGQAKTYIKNKIDDISRSNVKFSQRTHGTVNYMNDKEAKNNNKTSWMDSAVTESTHPVSKKSLYASEIGIKIAVLAAFIVFTYPALSWSLKDQIREYWPIFGNVYLDNRLSNVFAFINQNYPPKTTTLSTFYTGNYLPAFTNTVSFIGHSGYTYNIDEKQEKVRRFFENKMKDKEAKEFLMNNNIALVFQGPEEKPIYKDYLYPALLKPVYDREEVTLYILQNQ